MFGGLEKTAAGQGAVAEPLRRGRGGGTGELDGDGRDGGYVAGDGGSTQSDGADGTERFFHGRLERRVLAERGGNRKREGIEEPRVAAVGEKSGVGGGARRGDDRGRLAKRGRVERGAELGERVVAFLAQPFAKGITKRLATQDLDGAAAGERGGRLRIGPVDEMLSGIVPERLIDAGAVPVI